MSARAASGIGLMLAASVLVSCGDPEPQVVTEYVEVPVERPAAPPERPNSVILFIGDGMGPQQVGLLLDWADAAEVAPTQFARLSSDGVLGVLRTGALNQPVTDSASSATAFATGVEVANGVISVGEDDAPLRTCLEDARDNGRATGLVSTTRLTHATPACFAAHVKNRGDERTIAKQMVQEAGVDVMLGGGGGIIPAEKAREAGYRVVTTVEELDAADPRGGRLLGLFSRSHLPYAIDRDGPDEPRTPTLAQMTRKAIEVLSRDPDGFFLMVEGGRIDHGGHLNDVAAVLGEMREFDEALGAAREYVEAHDDTLLIVTADHETGGLAVTYGTFGTSPETFLAIAGATESIEALTPPVADREVIDPESFGVGRLAFYPAYAHWGASHALARSAKWNVSYGTGGHTTTPVYVVGFGPGAERLAGLHENEMVGLLLREWMSAAPRTGDDPR